MPRHGPRGDVAAPEQTDSHRVDIARQRDGVNTQLATLLSLLAPLEDLVNLPRQFVGQRRQVEVYAVPSDGVVYLFL